MPNAVKYEIYYATRPMYSSKMGCWRLLATTNSYTTSIVQFNAREVRSYYYHRIRYMDMYGNWSDFTQVGPISLSSGRCEYCRRIIG